MKSTVFLVISVYAMSATAQEICGRIQGATGQPLEQVMVQIYKQRDLKGGFISDMDGFYTVKPLDSGYYSVLFTGSGFDSVLIKYVKVSPGETTRRNVFLPRSMKGHTSKIVYSDFHSTEYPAIPKHSQYDTPIQHGRETVEIPYPLIKSQLTGVNYIIDDAQVIEPSSVISTPAPVIFGDHYLVNSEDMNILITTNFNVPGIYQARRGDDLCIFGARSTGNLYVIDGMRIMQ